MKILKKVVQHKEEWLFHKQIEEQIKNGFTLQGEKKLSSDGTWQALLTKEVNWNNPNHTPKPNNAWAKYN